MTTPETYTVRLPLASYCEVCQEAAAVKGQGDCPTCGTPLPAEQVAHVPQAVKARRTAFKTSLSRLDQRVTATAGLLEQFAMRGVPLGEDDHRDHVVLPALEQMGGTSRVNELLAGRLWDPQEEGTIEAFTELIKEIDAGRQRIEALRDTFPPLTLRAVHRELVRAAMAMVRGQATMAMTIASPDLDDARQKMAEGESWFDRGALHAGRIASLIRIISNSPVEGPIQADGAIDYAAAAWAGVGRDVTTIAAAADFVREAFAGVPGVSAAADEHILGLLPVLAMSARAVDFELLVARARQLRAVLDAADATGTWIADHGLLVERVLSGLERIQDETERLNGQWRHGLPRRHVARSLTEAYRELVEGALCDLGGALLIASRANRQEPNGTYEADAVEAVKAGEIVNEFLRLGPPCASSIDMLYRNASAHASVTVTDTGITATQREIRDGRVVSTKTVSLSDDEFGEEFLAVHETLLALQLAIWPWMTGHADPGMTAAVQAMRGSRRQYDQVLALLAGIAGYADVTITLGQGHMTIAAASPATVTRAQEIAILSVACGAFGTHPVPDRVTLQLTGRQPVTFTGGEFGEATEPNAQPHTPVLLGLITAKWLIRSTGVLTPQDEATYVTLPLADLHLRCAALAPSDRQGALQALQRALQRLDDVVPTQHRSAPTQEAAHQVALMIDFLLRLPRGPLPPGDAAEAAARARRAADSVELVHEILERARAVRDAPPSAGTPPQDR